MKPKTSALIVIFLLALVPRDSSALTLSEWERNDIKWRKGYVFGLMTALTGIVDSSNLSSMRLSNSYQKCFIENKFSSISMNKLLGRYILRNPEASTTDMLGNFLNAVTEACSSYLPDVEK